MGKPGQASEHILFCIALLTCLSISSYGSHEGRQVEKAAPEQGAREHLAGGRKALAQRNYQASLQEFEACFVSVEAINPPVTRSF